MTKGDFLERLLIVVEEQGGNKTPASIAEVTGFPWSTAKKWLDGSIPRQSTIVQLADHLSVSAKWLLGQSDKREKTGVIEEESATYNAKTNNSDRPLLSFLGDLSEAQVLELATLFSEIARQDNSKLALQGSEEALKHLRTRIK